MVRSVMLPTRNGGVQRAKKPRSGGCATGSVPVPGAGEAARVRLADSAAQRARLMLPIGRLSRQSSAR